MGDGKITPKPFSGERTDGKITQPDAGTLQRRECGVTTSSLELKSGFGTRWRRGGEAWVWETLRGRKPCCKPRGRAPRAQGLRDPSTAHRQGRGGQSCPSPYPSIPAPHASSPVPRPPLQIFAHRQRHCPTLRLLQSSFGFSCSSTASGHSPETANSSPKPLPILSSSPPPGPAPGTADLTPSTADNELSVLSTRQLYARSAQKHCTGRPGQLKKHRVLRFYPWLGCIWLFFFFF